MSTITLEEDQSSTTLITCHRLNHFPPSKHTMSVTGPFSHLNPSAPEFSPATIPPHQIPFFIPTTIYFPLPPPLNLLPEPSLKPTRAIMLLLPIPSHVTEPSIKRDMEQFGEVRGIQMERANEGIVIVHFFNLKSSKRAFNEIRFHYMQQQQSVWTHFVFPQRNAVIEGNNQGSLVIMNLEPTVSSIDLRHIFQAFGEVKQVRETPHKREQRFVEFFDVRDAAFALREMNGKDISGKPVLIQFSRPGGLYKRHFLTSHFHNHYHPPSQPLMVQSNDQIYEQQHKNHYYKKKSRKYKKKNLCAPRFLINENTIAAGEVRDGRTTVMIRNIPNKYTQEQFLNMLDTHCNDCNQKIIRDGNKTPVSSYDFVYLPIDFSNKCNVGYGFVNMTSPEAVWRLYNTFHNHHWKDINTKKICEITYARLQGLETLKSHFKNAKLPGVKYSQYMPVVFSPPRDGWSMTEPKAIVDPWDKPVTDEEKCPTRSDGCC